MKNVIVMMLLSLSLLETACNHRDSDISAYSDADVQNLKIQIEQDELWKEYINLTHETTQLITSNNLYANKQAAQDPSTATEVSAKLAFVKSDAEARQVFVNSGLTEAYASHLIKTLNCIRNLQTKFPMLLKVNPKKLNLTTPLPNAYPFNPTKDSIDFFKQLKSRNNQ